MNRYLRFLLYMLLQLGLLSGGLWLYTLLKGVPLSLYDFFTGKFFSLFILSFIPVLGALEVRRQRKKTDIAGLELKALTLVCSYRCTVQTDPVTLREKLREICNELFFPDRVFVKDYEDETVLAYRAEAFQNELGSRFRKAAVDPTVLVIETIASENGTDLHVRSETVGKTIGLNNFINEQNVVAVLRKLEENGLVGLTYRKPGSFFRRKTVTAKSVTDIDTHRSANFPVENRASEQP